MQINPPRIALFALGGTIAMTGSAQGVQPELSAADLIAGVPGLEGIARLEARSLSALPSVDLGFREIAALAEAIRLAVAAGVQGIVVTQGTDTLEETAFLLDLLLEVAVPVVMTGALRNPTLAGADGPANLLAAVRVASDPAAAGLGVVVVANDEIHMARHVRKTHISRPSSFASPTLGPIGWLVEDRVRVAVRPERRPSALPLTTAPVPHVALLTIAMGMDARDLAPLEAPDLAGAVIAGAGSGHVPSVMVEALEVVADRIPVVLASRVGAGEVYRKTYGYPGGEIDLQRRRLIPCGALDSLKARILLTALLASGADRAAIEAAFSGYWV